RHRHRRVGRRRRARRGLVRAVDRDRLCLVALRLRRDVAVAGGARHRQRRAVSGMAQPVLKLPELLPAAGPPSRARRFIALLGPNFTLFFFFLTILLVVGRVFGAHYVVRLSTLLLPGLAAPGIILVKMFPRWRRVWNDAPGARAEARKMALGTVRDWLPLVLVATVFDNLEDYTGIIRKVPIDDWLYRIDMAVFGVEPTVWIKKLYHPLVTDWMAFCYGIFFMVPMFLGITLCLRGRGADFREMATSVMLQMWIGFF